VRNKIKSTFVVRVPVLLLAPGCNTNCLIYIQTTELYREFTKEKNTLGPPSLIILYTLAQNISQILQNNLRLGVYLIKFRNSNENVL
jgi:hypothetical protein